jgi:hypothetical protein
VLSFALGVSLDRILASVEVGSTMATHVMCSTDAIACWSLGLQMETFTTH